MDEDIFQNNQEFKSLTRFVRKITKGNQKIENLKHDDVMKLRSLVDQAIFKLKTIYNMSQTQDLSLSNRSDEAENSYQKSTISVFNIITHSLYILSRHLTNRKYSAGSDDELIVSLHAQNEELEKENLLLKSKLHESLIVHSNDESNNGQSLLQQQIKNISGSSNDDTDQMLQYINTFSDEQTSKPKDNIYTRICQKLKLNKTASNEGEFIRLLQIEINKSKKIKQEIIRHYKLNFDGQNYVSLSNLIQSLDKHIKNEIENHDDLRGELFEATESLGQLKNELEYITKSVNKKEDKIGQLRRERNEARHQLNELLQSMKQNTNTNQNSFDDQDRRNETEDEEKELIIQKLTDQLEKANNSLHKKKQKIEKMKRKIENYEEKEMMNKQTNLISNLTNSMDNFEALLNKSQSKIESRSTLNDSSNKNDENLFDLKKEMINLKDSLSQKDEQITNLKSFVTDIASQYESASNELSEESKNKFELARCVQLLLDANKILEKLLETSNQQKEELKHQLENSIFRAQNTNANNNNNNNSNSDNELNDFDIVNDQFLLSKMKKMADDVFNDKQNSDDVQVLSRISKVFSNDDKSSSSLSDNNTDSFLEIYKIVLEFISSQKKKLNEINNDLVDEKNFTSRLYNACLGQLRFILDLSDSRMMQKWIFGDENEDWIRSSLQTQAARMESFFENYIESYNNHHDTQNNANNDDDEKKHQLNPIQQIQKDVFEDLLPLSKTLISTNENNEVSGSQNANNNHVENDLLIPLSTRITEYIDNYKDRIKFDQMNGQFKDLYLMVVQCIAANNVLQVLATEEGNQCKSQFNEIRNLQGQLSLINRNIYPSEENSPAIEPHLNNDEQQNKEEEEETLNKKKKKKTKNEPIEEQNENNNNNYNGNPDDVYKEIESIKNILRRTVSKLIKNNNQSISFDSNENKNSYSDLFVCLKCIEKAEKVSFNKDKYVRKLEKYLLKVEAIINEEIVSLQNECQSKIQEQEETVKKLNQQLSSRDNELKVLKESIMMLNFGDTSVIDEIHKQNREQNQTEQSNIEYTNNIEEEEEEEENETKQKMKNKEKLYEEMANKLRDEVDALQQKVAKMTKAKKNQSKLLSTIDFLTNQKKEIEEEQQKEKEIFSKTLENLQSENSQLSQKVNELNENISSLKDKLSKMQIENKLIKSRLKNEEEKSEREKSLVESRMKLKAFSIENEMKDKIEEAKKQQQSKQKELVVYIYNLFSGEVDLLMKNEQIDSDQLLMNKEVEDSIYSFLQAVKTKLGRLERSSYACESALNELNEIRSILENFISENRNKICSSILDKLEMNNKCSKILKEILNSFSEKVAKIQKQENELKQLKMDSLTASKVIEKAKEAVEWENWSKRVQRFITEGFEVKHVSPQPAPISPSQILAKKLNTFNNVARVPSGRDIRNKLEETIYSSVNGNSKKLIRKLEILRTEKNIMKAYHSNAQVQHCLFYPQFQDNGRYIYRSDDNISDDGNNRCSNISIHHLIIIALIAKRVEKLSGHVPSFIVKRNVDQSNANNNKQAQNINKRAVKPIFSQFISPL